MPNVIVSPNMNLPVPVVSSEPGPQYATDVNNCMAIVDIHDHSLGNGVQITPSGISISSDLPFNNNNATLLRTSRYKSQSAALGLVTDIGCLYVVTADLYYNDTAGNQIRLTQGGSIVGSAGSITGLPSGTASASYSAGTFTWQSATNTSAVMDFGSAILRNNTASSKGLTLSPPSAMAADFGLVLPNVPLSTKIMSLDSSGNMAAVYGVDNSTIEISSNNLQVKDLGIVTEKIANSNVTQPKLYTRSSSSSASAGQVAQSNYSNNNNITSTSPVAITSQISLVCTGRPVMVFVMGNDGTTYSPTLFCTSTNGGTLSVYVDGVFKLSTQFGNATGTQSQIPCLQWMFTPASGSHTFQLYCSVNVNNLAVAQGLSIIAYELN